MSLDELMELASEPSTAPTVQIRRPPSPSPSPTQTQSPTPTATPAPLNPAAAKPTAAPQPPVAATSRLEPALDKAREFLLAVSQWLRRGDNGLIAGTALVALLLLVVVASL
jgi:hypothetical protein